eukprot:CAMPEP_0201578024 /NCGR_PEP_ID=MMETSP0190_2-20130828/24663_1 /ASSEMBLY_ACC=CAM_ASM_000263 /TAXON_ID=37353 /ORGANISM="Rosalina sp." /LENGTH=553 /DNA_ID=CAMNT_0048010727 /DNA_START=63 /DNA_END=1721 /DNA_ORIENTATION=+
MSKGVSFQDDSSSTPQKGVSAKNRAQTAWDLSLDNNGQQTQSYQPDRSSYHRGRAQTGANDTEITNPTMSPRRSVRPINMKRPLTERGTKAIQKMWVHSTSTSVFSMHGMEAMLAKLGGTGGNRMAMGRTSQDTITSNNGFGAHYKSSSIDNGGSPTSPGSNTQMADNMSVIFNRDNEEQKDWETKIKKWETEGEWVECRETLTGRVMWYNSISNRLVFDMPPDGVTQLPPTQYTKDIGPKHDEFFLNRPIEPYEDEDIVAGLLQFDSHQWDFNNSLCSVYRAQAYKRDHRKMLPQPQQYCFPEYFSMSPLPELPGGKFLAKIRLPEEFSAHRRYSSVQIKVDYTAASDAIKQGVEKLDHPFNKERKDFILKVVGQEAYMYGRRKIIDYEAVRDAVRNENDVEFVLIQRKDFKERVDAEKLKQKEYQEHFAVAYPSKVTDNADGLLKYESLSKSGKIEQYGGHNSLSKGGSSSKSSNTDFQPRDVISLYDCEWHYRLKIEGLTNVTSLPRFDDSTMKSVYVVAELWMGDMIFDHATLMTKSSTPLNDIRWGQW